MDTRFQQFFNADTNHRIPLVKSSSRQGGRNHLAEHEIDFSVVVATVLT